MRFHYGGKYNSEEDLKSKAEPREGAVAFKEPSEKVFAIIANGGCLVVLIILAGLVYYLARPDLTDYLISFGIAGALSVVVLIPHELLHAICFKGDVYMYFNPSKFLAFVHGTESMSKVRFIFLSLLPNIVFGVIPFVVFLFNPKWFCLGMFGALCISMGFGDYINAFNAIIQMPAGARTYLDGFHSYWYMPFEIKQEDPFFDSANQAYVLKPVRELREGKGSTHELIEDGDE